MDIAVIGSNMVDLITYTNQMPKEGETLEAPAFKIGCGGKGANQAVAAAKLNSKVLMLTKVGDDIFADNTIRNLESWGINTTYVEKSTVYQQRRSADFRQRQLQQQHSDHQRRQQVSLAGRYRSRGGRFKKMPAYCSATGSSA
ncbi:ribokinase [Salmonella enterica subsp. enterica]|nr:ribokinase [Salmonella enterica subsp. enterica]